MSTATTHLETLRAFLFRGRNADGGWGYQPGKASRLEPTCWALLALGPAADPAVLQQWPAVDGRLLERRGGTPNYAFHGQALIALRALGVEHAGGNRALLAALQRVKGVVVPPAPEIVRQDSSLQGWSWIDGTFSWLEPTAWCLLALKLWARRSDAIIDRARIDTAERLLIDRCCEGGGWNYGTSNTLGQPLKAFVPTTALALLALRDRTLPEVDRSLAFLERDALQERSGTALSLALVALGAFDRSVTSVRDTLIRQVPTTLAFGKHAAAAMSLFALDEERGHGAVAL